MQPPKLSRCGSRPAPSPPAPSRPLPRPPPARPPSARPPRRASRRRSARRRPPRRAAYGRRAGSTRRARPRSRRAPPRAGPPRCARASANRAGPAPGSGARARPPGASGRRRGNGCRGVAVQGRPLRDGPPGGGQVVDPGVAVEGQGADGHGLGRPGAFEPLAHQAGIPEPHPRLHDQLAPRVRPGDEGAEARGGASERAPGPPAAGRPEPAAGAVVTTRLGTATGPPSPGSRPAPRRRRPGRNRPRSACAPSRRCAGRR